MNPEPNMTAPQAADGTRQPSPPAPQASQASQACNARQRVVIDAVRPQVDCGRTPIKRLLGDAIEVQAELLVDGHEQLAGVLRFRRRGSVEWREEALAPAASGVRAAAPGLVSDVWCARFVVDALGVWEYTVSAWVNAWGSWAWGLRRKLEAGQADLDIELRTGAALMRAAATRASGRDAETLHRLVNLIAGNTLPGPSGRGEEQEQSVRARLALGDEVETLMRAYPDRSAATTHEGSLQVTVDPPRASFSSWYEMFPRSCGPEGRHGTFGDAAKRLPYIADMGFDVLYLPPIHPIGRAHRKGPDNALIASERDPGSPWAIGAPEGGHLAVHPELGTLDDFRQFVIQAREHGLEIALDIALQASPDHPYVREHPEWFVHRPDGSIQYAENPPKKYEDIYPFDLAGPAWEALWQEARGIFLHWIEQGVRIFRVDNPHTKPIPFWRWCLGSIKEQHPEVIFLAEAFTRPKLMYALAKAGFSQSYTYFTWRNTKAEIASYVSSIADTEVKEFFRPNFWPNTPDILPEHLQLGTRATFIARATLAATLSPSWGVYGPAYELQEKEARAGSEEYAQNEKYQLRSWDLARPDSLRPILRRLNHIRRDNPALHRVTGTVFHPTDQESILCYSRVDAEAADPILVVVNLDPHNRQSGWITLDLAVLGIAGDARFQVHDLMGDSRYLWQGPRAFVSLAPEVMPVHVFRIRRHVHTERTFEYYL